MGRAWVLPSYTGTSSCGASGAVALQILAQQWSFVHALHRAAASDGFVAERKRVAALFTARATSHVKASTPLQTEGHFETGADMPACNPPETTPEFTPLHRLEFTQGPRAPSGFQRRCKVQPCVTGADVPACRRPPVRRARCRSCAARPARYHPGAPQLSFQI